MKVFFNWLDEKKDLGVLSLRLFVSTRLIYGVLDNVIDWEKMLEFRDFLHAFNFPIPIVCAVVSVYVQLFAGLCYLIGWQIRLASILMIINFSVAVLFVHLGQTFEQMTPALALLFISILFLFNGAGKYSVDKIMNRTKD